MNTSIEDKKISVEIGIKLSLQIINVSLTIILIITTFVTFVLKNRQNNNSVYLLFFLSFLCFIVSIFCGGKGIDKARKEGAKGNWELSLTKKYFNWQSIFAIVGIIIFLISVFFL